MFKRNLVIGIVLLLVVALPFTTMAAGGNGNGKGNGKGSGNGGGGAYNNAYFDPSTVQSFTGTLINKTQDWTSNGNGNHTGDGGHFQLKTNSGTIYELMLGNWNYMVDQGLNLQEGDTVNVTGSVVDPYRSDATDYDYIIATEINGVQLRDADGYPLWSKGQSNGGKGNGQYGKGGGNGNGNAYFDPETVETYTGTLSEALGLWMACGNGNYTGTSMHYVFKSNNGKELYTMFGPYWYLEDNGIELEEGLKVTLTGSVVAPYYDGYNDRDYIIVTSITSGGTTVDLRDENGYPLWKGTGNHYQVPEFENNSVEKVAGSVTAVRTRSNGANLDDGLQLKVKADNGKRYTIYVAPEYYCEMLGLTVKKGERITVRGSVNGKNIVARSLNDGTCNYNLRDKKGNPKWQVGN